MVTSPDNRHVLVCDLGLDEVVSYTFDAATGAMAVASRAAVHAGAGPRHLAFTPDHAHVVVLNELDNTACLFAYDAGVLRLLHTVSSIPEDYKAAPPFDFYIAPSHASEVACIGSLCIAANRGHDSLAVFRIADGQLTRLHCFDLPGRIPWHFELVPGPPARLLASCTHSRQVIR